MKFFLSFALALSSLAALGQVPAAITADPSSDKTAPAAMEQLAIPSHGATMNGFIYLAAGADPHPTVILLHGFPGYEQNLDLAQSIRRAGWNVLFFHYRGSWGSQGSFSFSNSIEDTQTAIAWTRDPQNAKKFRIDPAKIILIGHSMGGFMASAAGRDPKVMAIAMLAAWNIGADDRNAKDPAKAKAFLKDKIQPLFGCTADSLFAEMTAHKGDWDYNSFAPQLKNRPVLVVSTNDNLRAVNDAFVAAMMSAGASRVTAVHFPTDHGLNDHRIALQATVLDWLKGLLPASEGQRASADSPVQFLIASAATDFHSHPPTPGSFRHVRMGHINASDNAKQYMLCGEFLPAQKDGKAEWTPFATIKTSGYEQWLGMQAANFCQRSTIVWDDNESDLSSALQSRFESIR